MMFMIGNKFQSTKEGDQINHICKVVNLPKMKNIELVRYGSKLYAVPRGAEIIIPQGKKVAEYKGKRISLWGIPMILHEGIVKKICGHCFKWLPLDRFYFSKSNVGGRKSVCAECAWEAEKRRRVKRRQAAKTTVREGKLWI
jgi:hypothetical protein